MVALHWADCDRDRLSAVLPDALVVLPAGAVEQHGPHLPSGTDLIIATAVTEAAAYRAEPMAGRDLVLAPPVAFGASAHHLEFGGTLSLSARTLTAVLLDLVSSIATSGGRRLVIVNGHGGNRGPAHTAAATAATQHGVAVAYFDYWAVLDGDPPAAPGHAGEFETSLIQHLRPATPISPPDRARQPEVPSAPGATVHTPDLWRRIDGYTDHPASATPAAGARWFDLISERLAGHLVTLSGSL